MKTIISWCPGQNPPNRCDPCAPTQPPSKVGHLFFTGDVLSYPGMAVVLFESGQYADVGKPVNVTVNFTVSGTDTNPSFSASANVPFPGLFHSSLIPIPVTDLGKPVGDVLFLTITAHTTADYDSPFFPFTGTYEPPGTGTGTTVYCSVYQLNTDGSKAYISGWNANGG